MIFPRRVNLFLKSIGLSKSSKKSIKNNLGYILTFSEFKRRLNWRQEDFFFKPSRVFYRCCDSNTQQAAEEILAHCGLNNTVSVRITHEYLHIPRELTVANEFNPDLPGQVYSLGKYQFTIFINKTYSPKIIAATLAHEISHIYVRHNEISFKTSGSEKAKFEEQMTDLVTIVLGLGRLMLEGNSYYFGEGDTVYHGTLGYLKPDLMEYAEALMELKMGGRNREIINVSKVS